MGLVEVSGLVHGVQDGGPIAQQVGREAGPFDLAELRMRHTGGAPEVTLDRSDCERLSVTAYRGRNHVVPRDQAAPSEPVDVAFRVVQVRQRPAETLELERSVGRHRQIHIVMIEQQVGRQRRYVHAEPEADRGPFAVGWALDGRRPGLGAAQCHHRDVGEPRHHQLEMAGGDRLEGAAAIAASPPYPFDVRRIRWPVRKAEKHSADAFLEVHGDLVACFFADALTQVGLHRKFVGAVAERHERARERLAVNGAADRDQSAGAEEGRRIGHHHIGPAALVLALLQCRSELPVEGFVLLAHWGVLSPDSVRAHL
jgi:hypothetical protein